MVRRHHLGVGLRLGGGRIRSGWSRWSPEQGRGPAVERPGADAAGVRLVPLPDGRVVLVTGDDVSFFPL